jgi:hypothetical protein
MVRVNPGAFRLRNDGKYDYYASERWLPSDHVIDITAGPGNLYLFLPVRDCRFALKR